MFTDSMRIIPCLVVTVVDIEHTLTRRTCHVSTEYYVKRSYSQHVDVAICKIAYIEDNHQEIDVHSANNIMDCYEPS
jgi:hypothetical protein